MTTTINPACASCPVAARAAGCGYLAAGTDCQHPRQRELWLAAGSLRESRNVTEILANCDCARTLDENENLW